MKLNAIYNNSSENPVISFEVFPPRGGQEFFPQLVHELSVLKKFSPALVSLTYGAGGSNNNSLELIKILTDICTVMPHFTCICNDRSNVISSLNEFKNLGIENILALRGDIPGDKNIIKNDFKYANELIEFIKKNSTLSVGAAGYPEGHIEAENLDFDINNLKKKVDAGAEVIFTQLFFDNSKFFNYTEKLRKVGITLPVVAGIMPVMSIKQIEKITSMAKVTLPVEIVEKLDKFKNYPDDIKKFGIEYASRQCSELKKFGVTGLHFYTLNKSYSVAKILENI